MKAKHISSALNTLAPDAQWKYNDTNLDSLEWLTPEIAKPSKEEIIAQAVIEEEKEQTEIKQKENAKTSALAKLAALGLTEEEIAAL